MARYAIHLLSSRYHVCVLFFFFNDTATTEIYTLSLHDALPISNAINMAFGSGKVAAPFPRCPWALDLRDKNFPGRQPAKAKGGKDPLTNLGAWYWESGFDRDPRSEEHTSEL